MRRLLFANLVTRQPSYSTAGEAASFPALAAGQQYPIAVRWLDEVNGRLLVTEPDVAAIRASVGRVDARPPSGTWKLQIGEGASTSANTTAALDFSISASALASAISALEDVDTAIAVDFDAGSYVFHAADGSRLTLTMRGNRLLPISFGRIRDYELDGEWYSELRLIQAPVAFTSNFDTVLPPPPSITTVRDGGTDPSGTFFWNEIQKLYIPPDFQGLYQLRRNFARTGLLSRADGPDEIQAALNKILAAENASVTVTNPAQNTAHIEFRGDLSGVDLAELEVSVFSAPPGDLTFTLDLNTAEVWAMLRDQASVSLPFELEADFYIDPADHAAGIRTVKVWSASLTITRPVGWEGLASSATIDWLRPASPRSYIPFTIDQVLTGQQQAFSAVIGDGDETTFTIDHNLSSELCQVVVRENVSGGRLLRPDEYAVVLDSSDSLTLTFDEAPDSGALACYVVAIGPESVFQSHTHEIEQINGLQDTIDNLSTRVATLETILPSVGPAGSTTQPSGIEIAFPETKEILFYRGADPVESLFSEKGIDATKLPRAPLMLPAIHSASATSFDSETLPALAADSLWENESDAVLNLGRGPAGGRVAIGGYFASDGRALYAVTRAGATTSYFPTGFNRELWRIFISDKMLRLNRTLNVQFGLALQLIAATSNAQWLLVIEHGAAPEQNTPSTPSTNLENVVWDSTPLLSQRLILTANRQTHSFGARIRRSLVSSVDTITADTLLYGVWEGANAMAPSTANFALRARLVQFDTENSLASDARGHVAYELIGSEKEGKAKAIIT